MWREGSWVVASQALTAVMAILGVRVVTELVPPHVYGVAALCLGAVAVLQQLVSGPVLQVAQQLYPGHAHSAKQDLFRKGIRLALRWRLIGAVCLLTVVGAVWSPQVEEPITLGLAGGALLLTDVGVLAETSLLNAARRQSQMARVLVGRSVARVAGVVLLAAVAGLSAAMILTGYAIGNLFALVLARVGATNRRHSNGQLSATDVGVVAARLLTVSRPLIWTPLVSWTTNQADRYVVGALAGLSSAGIYSSVYGLTNYPFLMLGGVLDGALRPVYYQRVADGDQPGSRQVLKVWAMVMVAGTGTILLAVTLFHRSIANLVLASDYRAASYLMVPIALGYGLVLLIQMSERICFAHADLRSVALISYVGGLVSLLVSVPMIAAWGILGAAYAVPIYFGIQLSFAGSRAIRVLRPASSIVLANGAEGSGS